MSLKFTIFYVFKGASSDPGSTWAMTSSVVLPGEGLNVCSFFYFLDGSVAGKEAGKKCPEDQVRGSIGT